MKVLFAVSNENISSAIIKRYPKEYTEILSYKNVYYFNAILKEIQKDKSYDRIVISEDLEPFVNSNHDSIDNFIFEHLDRISDEANDTQGKETAIILICSERRAPGSPILNKLFSIGIYNAVMGKDRNLTELCKLINRPRTKKEAKAYYGIEQANYDPVAEDEVNEVEIQNILAHFKKLGKDTERYADSFNNIASQYTDEQLRVIIKVLPIKVKAVLESDSPKYQELMGANANANADISAQTNTEPGISINTIGKSGSVNGPIVIPTGVKNATPRVVSTSPAESDQDETVNSVQTASESPQPMQTAQSVQTKSVEHATVVKQVVKPIEPKTETVVQPEITIQKEDVSKADDSTLPGMEAKEEDSSLLGSSEAPQEENSELPGMEDSAATIDLNDEKNMEIPDDNQAKPNEFNDVNAIENNVPKTEVENPVNPVNNVEVQPKKRGRGRPRKNPLPEPEVKQEATAEPTPENTNNDLSSLLGAIGSQPAKEEPSEDDSILPGMDEEPDADNSELPGMDEEIDADNSELPGMDEEPEVDNSELPGMDEEPEVDNSELPGMDEEIDVNNSELPGMDEELDADNSELPGMDEEIETDNSELPGMDEEPEVDNSEAGDVAEESGEELDIDSLLGGLDSPDEEIPQEDNVVEESTDINEPLENDESDEDFAALIDENDSDNEEINFSSDEFENISPDNTNNLNNVEPEQPKSTDTIETIQPKIDYSMSNLNSLLSKDKKIVSFVGTTKNGTSFLVNNLALMFSLMGINTAILDMTENRNSYYIFTDSREELRNIAYTSIGKLENGYPEGIKFNKNFTVYTALPADGNKYENAEPILSTLVQNHSLVLIDCDFQTPPAYFASSQEIYLVQSMDILTIQPLTAFLRELKFKGAWEPEKARVVINKATKVKSINEKIIIAGMSRYNGPDMSVMTDLFNKDMVKACSIPFDEKVYSKYLETLATCKLSLNGYSKAFMQKLQILGDMVYPMLNSKKTYGPMDNARNGQNQSGTNNFSNNMNNTLDQMKNNY